MERIKLDLKDSVYELCKIHPDIIDILINLGFKDIRQAFLEKGYEV